jgi:hypothetical protein
MGKTKTNSEGPYWVRLGGARGIWSVCGAFDRLRGARAWADESFCYALVMTSTGRIVYCTDKRKSVLREVAKHNAALSGKGRA